MTPLPQNTLQLSGCRHDILGHYLKAIGLLRVLDKCAAPEHRDPDAEGWWNTDDGAFYLRSGKYDTTEKLTEFFVKHYWPTPVFSAWNGDSGLDNAGAARLNLQNVWQTANNLSQQVVSAAERKKPQNADKLLASEAFAIYRNTEENMVSEAIDAISASFIRFNSDNDLFMSKGLAGRSHILRTYWGYLVDLEKLKKKYIDAKTKLAIASARQRQKLNEKLQLAQDAFVTHLISGKNPVPAKGKGTPFFPDAIKTYNVGGGWVEENFPFAALDYILAVEGAFAMRGSVSRTLGANTRRFAAFPFVFDSGEDLVDDGNKVKGTASSLWLPIWDRPATFAELSSFIADAQARLPKKEVRFSAEFLRALHSQGIDAGFSGWQEFRFRMKGSRVPWVTAGTFSEAKYSANATLLNRAIEPFDSPRFIDQFETLDTSGRIWSFGEVGSHSPHRIRAEINSAIENAVVSTTAENCLEILCEVFSACKKMALSKTFRKKSLENRPPRFSAPLIMAEWRELLHDLEAVPEFDIARAVASIVGLQKQRSGEYSKVQPMLGSLLPLKLGKNGWYLPSDNDRSNQAVWSGADLCRDLAAVLWRRYMDSLKDDYPALQSVFPARLESILDFLNGELDDHKIARWIEALSLIGWRFEKTEKENSNKGNAERAEVENSHAVPPCYAALRTLLELESAYQKAEEYKRRRSEQPIAQLCTCSSHALAQATCEALRWVAVWGVENPWGEKSRREMASMKGAYIINLDRQDMSIPEAFLSPERTAAAIAIPLFWRDHFRLHQVVTMPISA
jgi:CRISPR-associated protein Csx17